MPPEIQVKDVLEIVNSNLKGSGGTLGSPVFGFYYEKESILENWE